MCELTYITSIEELSEYCKIHQERLSHMQGECKSCLCEKKCRFDYRELQIDSLMRMPENESRFSVLLKAGKSIPGLLYCIPAKTYKSVYGGYNSSLPCPFHASMILENIKKIKQVYSMLNDELSKKTYLNILMYRLTQNREFAIRAYCMEPQYFIKSFSGLGRNEVFVDCGAYTGDTIDEYCKYNSAPKTAYLFEPDRENISVMQKNVQKYSGETDIRIIGKGVHKRKNTLFLSQSSGGNMASFLTDIPQKNSIEVDVTSIDEEITEDVSFIKMDVEGSERWAIEGAKDHILRTYPKLAICLYHRIDDLWELPIMIKTMFPGYTDIKIRHHTSFYVDTLLYAYRK